VLGSTGSIGTSTLDVVEAHPDLLHVVALAAGRNRELFRSQCERFRPACVSVAEPADAVWLRSELSYAPEILHGSDGLMACALHPEADTLVAAVVGATGLASTEAALRAGRRVCVANKESLVVGGELMHQAREAGEASSSRWTRSMPRCISSWRGVPPKRSGRCGSRPVEALSETGPWGASRLRPSRRP